MTTNALPNQFSWNSYKVTNGYRLYDLQVGSPLIKIAVIDSGYDPNHSEITGNIDKKKSCSFVDYENFNEDLYGHGTAVISVIVGKNQVKGVAPGITIISYKVLDRNGFGKIEWVIHAILKAIEDCVHIINLSHVFTMFGLGNKGAFNKLQQAINKARKKGIIIVGATGNQGVLLDMKSTSLYPTIKGINYVTSTNKNNYTSSYANIGSIIRFAAPSGELDETNNVTDLIIVAHPTNFPKTKFEKAIGLPDFYTVTCGTSISANYVFESNSISID
nr:S8 family serine peptidase [Bacillus subtilis]